MLTTAQIRTLLARMVHEQAGGNEARWRELIGPLELDPRVLSPQVNWTVAARGNAAQRTAIRSAVEIMQAKHPFVRC